jgi:hypothetical protein
VVDPAAELDVPVADWWDERPHVPGCRVARIYFPSVGRTNRPEVRRLGPEEAMQRLERDVLPFPVRRPAYRAWGDTSRTLAFWRGLLADAHAYQVQLSFDTEASLEPLVAELSGG